MLPMKLPIHLFICDVEQMVGLVSPSSYSLLSTLVHGN